MGLPSCLPISSSPHLRLSLSQYKPVAAPKNGEAPPGGEW